MQRVSLFTRLDIFAMALGMLRCHQAHLSINLRHHKKKEGLGL